MTEAHSEEVTIRLLVRWPAHEPRKSDPHFKAFREAKARLKRLGLLKCNVDSEYHAGEIELHHAAVEFAHINDVSVEKTNRLYGLHLTDEGFKDWAEGAPAFNDKGEEVNGLEPLCLLHHRGTEGIHSLDGPTWNVLRTAKDPERLVEAQFNNEIPVQRTS